MSNIDTLICSLNTWIEKAEASDDITKQVPDFPGIENVPGYISDYENSVAKLLRDQKKYFIDAVKGFVKKDDTTDQQGQTVEALLVYFTQNLFAADTFVQAFGEETAAILTSTISDLTTVMMESIDKDVAFDTLSKRTTDWIESWSQGLAELMKLKTHTALEKILKDGIENGESIQQIELKLKDLPEFDRARARTTAITEILTACSASQLEAYSQSPAVTGKKWRHSGGKNNHPRENHVALDGTEVAVDGVFEIPVSLETCQFPRDPVLTAGERVNCHCALSPVVDEAILGLSKEEKDKIREEAMKELNK